jgi:urea transport system permease protein
VKEEIETGIALSELDSDKTPQRLAAIDRLSKSLNPDVYNRLASLTDASGETDAGVRNAAGAALRHIDSWRKFYGVLETLFFGLSLGSVLVLSAIGLAITFGVMGHTRIAQVAADVSALRPPDLRQCTVGGICHTVTVRG